MRTPRRLVRWLATLLALSPTVAPCGAAPVNAARAVAPAASGATAPRARPATDEDRRFRLEDVLNLATISDPAWSHDGRRVAFVVNAPDTAEDTNNQDLWLADLERGSTFRLTRHAKNDFSPTFSPSGDTIAFVATRASGDDAKSGIWLMSLHGGDPWPLRTFDESIGEVQWSPDGHWLAYVKLDTLPRAVRDWQKKKWDQVIEDDRPQHPRLWVVPVSSICTAARSVG